MRFIMMRLQAQPTSGLVVTGLVVMGIFLVLFLILLVPAWRQTRKERERALKGRWMSWAEYPSQRGEGGGDGGGCGP
jgi:hypothetical protein